MIYKEQIALAKYIFLKKKMLITVNNYKSNGNRENE